MEHISLGFTSRDNGRISTCTDEKAEKFWRQKTNKYKNECKNWYSSQFIIIQSFDPEQWCPNCWFTLIDGSAETNTIVELVLTVNKNNSDANASKINIKCTFKNIRLLDDGKFIYTNSHTTTQNELQTKILASKIFKPKTTHIFIKKFQNTSLQSLYLTGLWVLFP